MITDVINWTSLDEALDAMLYVTRCNVQIISSMKKNVRDLKKETDQLKQKTNVLMKIKEKRNVMFALSTDEFDPTEEKPSY